MRLRRLAVGTFSCTEKFELNFTFVFKSINGQSCYYASKDLCVLTRVDLISVAFSWCVLRGGTPAKGSDSRLVRAE